MAKIIAKTEETYLLEMTSSDIVALNNCLGHKYDYTKAKEIGAEYNLDEIKKAMDDFREVVKLKTDISQIASRIKTLQARVEIMDTVKNKINKN